MSTKLVKYLVILTSTVILRAEIIPPYTATHISSCTGSLILTSPTRFGSLKLKFLTRQSWLDKIQNFPRITITKVEVHGCGCFQVYRRKNGRGTTFSLRSDETIKKGDKKFFRHAKSMKRVKCSQK